VSNSGFVGGKFLERQRVRKHDTGKHESVYITEADVLVDLPATVWINGYPFVLLECDRFTLRYRNKGNIASLLSIDSVHEKIALAIADGKTRGRTRPSSSSPVSYFVMFVQRVRCTILMMRGCPQAPHTPCVS